jgi:hypothetical protein
VKKAAIFFLILLLVLPLISKYHPEIKWKEISDTNFIVIFPESFEVEASHTLQIAHSLYPELIAIWGKPVMGKIRILITDVYDQSNGNATIFPFNKITIYLYTPPPDSVLGNCREWIRLVLSHELSHVFYLNTCSRFIRVLRNILGQNPFLFPMNFSPVWMQEGMAIYGESKMNPAGRLNSPDYSIILENMAQSGSVPRWRDISGEPTFWPGPQSKYLFGSKFIEYLVEHYGENKIPQLVRYYARNFFYISTSFRYKCFFKKWLTPLWNDFRNNIDISGKASMSRKLAPLTSCGMSKQYPIVTGQNKALYVYQNYKNHPGIWEINLKTRETTKLLEQANITGMSFDSQSQTIYFSALDYYKAYYKFSDLYQYNLKTSQLKRLSSGSRLSCPARLQGSSKVFCVKRKKSKSYLATFDLNTGRERIISKGFDGISFLSISPDKETIAVSLKRKNENWGIALFNLNGKLLKMLGHGSGKNYYPQWKSNHELGFVSEHEQYYRLGMTNLNSGKTHIYTETGLPAIRYFTFLPDRDEVLLSYYDSNGYNLGLMNLPDIMKDPLNINMSHVENKAETVPVPQKGKKYNVWRDLLPKYLNFNFRYAGNEIQPGIIISGNDVPFNHQFTLQGFYGPVTNSINLSFNYTFSGLYPTLLLNASDLTDLNYGENNRDYHYSIKQLELVCLYPLLYTEKYQSYVYSNIHFERITERYFSPDEKFRLDLNGLKLGFLFNSAKRYYDSFSQSDGMALAITYSRDFEFMGSDFDLNTLALEYKQFIRFPKPSVLAFRLGISDSWGKGKRFIYMGGANSKMDHHIAGGSMFDLMRGYPSGYFSGTGGFLLNLEYRLPLVKMERAVFISQSVERFYISVFADIGNMWEDVKQINVSYSLGTELNMVLFLGGRITISGGVAIGRNPFHDPVFYLRIGESF